MYINIAWSQQDHAHISDTKAQNLLSERRALFVRSCQLLFENSFDTADIVVAISTTGLVCHYAAKPEMRMGPLLYASVGGALGSAVTQKSCDTGDFGECLCDAGLSAVGGVCAPLLGSKLLMTSLFSENSPNAAGNGWKCGGGGASKRITVMCAPASTVISYASGGADTVATCGHENPYLVGGGCKETNGLYYGTSIPLGTTTGNVNQWKCGNSASPTPAFEARAICSTHPIATFPAVNMPLNSAEIPSAPCTTLLGGGCRAVNSVGIGPPSGCSADHAYDTTANDVASGNRLCWKTAGGANSGAQCDDWCVKTQFRSDPELHIFFIGCPQNANGCDQQWSKIGFSSCPLDATIGLVPTRSSVPSANANALRRNSV
jgi:hypothetical protein